MISTRNLPLIDYYPVVRCPCNKPITGVQWDTYQRLTTKGIEATEYNEDAEDADLKIGVPGDPEAVLDFLDIMKDCCRDNFLNPVAVISNHQERDYVEGKRYFSSITPVVSNSYVISLPTGFPQPVITKTLELSTVPLTETKAPQQIEAKSTSSLIASGSKSINLPSLSDSFRELTITPSQQVQLNYTPKKQISVGSGMYATKVASRTIQAR